MNWWTSNWASRWRTEWRADRRPAAAGLGVGLLLAILAGPGGGDALAQAPDPGERAVLLVASRGLPDARFRESVVLVIRHGRQRTPLGVILNKPLERSLASVLPDVAPAARQRLHYGGPVDGNVLLYLARGERPTRGAIAIADRIHLGLDREHLTTLLGEGAGPDRLRVFAGYAVWAPGQLDREIAQGDWHLLRADEKSIFPVDPGRLWPDLIRRATLIQARGGAHPVFARAGLPGAGD
jgi:putative transcriptional regulator